MSQTLKIMASLALLLSFSLPFHQHARAISNEFISTVFNKSAREYKQGDVFSVKITPKSRAFIYVFYVDHKNYSHALYPGQVDNENPVKPDNPLTVSKMTQGVLTIDSNQGKLITVALLDNQEGRRIRDFVLSEEDFMYMNPFLHRLDISGTQLMGRFQMLKKEHPQSFHFMVENAPRAQN